MAEIRINVVVKSTPQTIYKAITTQEGLAAWWAKETIAKPEVGFRNVFTFGTIRNEMEVTALVPGRKVEWKCVESIEEWIDTRITFDLEEREGKTLVRFGHVDWRAATDMLAGCTYDWARFMQSLKSLCETGSGTPS